MSGTWQRGMRAGQSPANMQMRPPTMSGAPHTPEGNKRSSDGKPRSSKRYHALMKIIL